MGETPSKVDTCFKCLLVIESVRGTRSWHLGILNNGSLLWPGHSEIKALKAATGHRGGTPRYGREIVIVSCLFYNVLDHLIKMVTLC